MSQTEGTDLVTKNPEASKGAANPQSYPNELAQRDHYDDLLGKGPGDPDSQRYIGIDKPNIEHHNADSEIVTDNQIEEVPF